MKTSSNGIRFITQYEGFKAKPYRDVAGLLTIGVGHLLTEAELDTGNIQINSIPIYYHNGLTHQQVRDLLAQDLQRFEKAVHKVKVPLEQHEFDALVSFAFNIGTTAFNRSTLVKLLKLGLTQQAADEFPKWNKAGGRVVQGLVNRRAAEQKLFLTGEF